MNVSFKSRHREQITTSPANHDIASNHDIARSRDVAIS